MRGTWLVLTALLAFAPARAAEVRLRLERTWTYDDEAVGLQVEIVDPPRGVRAPRLEPVEGIDIAGPGYATQKTTIVNGVRTSGVIFPFEVRPRRGRTGRFTIGPARIALPGGETLTSGTGEIAVVRRPPQGIQIRCEVTPKGGPVGQPFRVTYTIRYAGEPYEGGGFFSDRYPLGFQKLEIPLLDRPGLRVKPVGTGRKAEVLRLARDKQVTIERGFDVEKGFGWPTYAMTFEVYPTEPGEIDLGGASAAMVLVTGYRVVRDFPFGTRREPTAKVFSAASEPVVYRVEELPAEGRPPGFSGAVGRFTAEARAEPTEVDAYAPIDLELRVRGEGLLENLKPPVWEEMEDLARDFEISSDVDPGKVEDGARVFHEQIRPKGPHVERIPPIPYPYYEPEKRRYETAWTEAIPIRVRAVETVKAEEAMPSAREERAAPAPAAPRARPAPITSRAGVRANYDHFGRRVTSLRPLAQLVTPGFLGGLAIPPLAFAALLLGRRLRRRDPEVLRTRKAAGRARAALAARDLAPEAISGAYQDYFRDRLGLGGGEIVPGDLALTLKARGVAEDAAGRAARLLDRIQAASFGGTAAGEPRALAAEARGAIEEVERCLR